MKKDIFPLIELPKISDNRGNLSVVEVNNHINFKIKRVYYMYDIPIEATRGSHGHKKLQQLLIPLAGNFEVILDDGCQKEKYQLSDPSVGLYVAPMRWRELKNFSAGAVCLALVSEYYDEADYFRNYDEFIQAASKKGA